MTTQLIKFLWHGHYSTTQTISPLFKNRSNDFPRGARTGGPSDSSPRTRVAVISVTVICSQVLCFFQEISLHLADVLIRLMRHCGGNCDLLGWVLPLLFLRIAHPSKGHCAQHSGGPRGPIYQSRKHELGRKWYHLAFAYPVSLRRADTFVDIIPSSRQPSGFWQRASSALFPLINPSCGLQEELWY